MLSSAQRREKKDVKDLLGWGLVSEGCSDETSLFEGGRNETIHFISTMEAIEGGSQDHLMYNMRHSEYVAVILESQR